MLFDMLCLFKINNKETRMKSVGVVLVSIFVTLNKSSTILSAPILFFMSNLKHVLFRKQKLVWNKLWREMVTKVVQLSGTFFRAVLLICKLINELTNFLFCFLEAYLGPYQTSMVKFFLWKWLTTCHSGQNISSKEISVLYFVAKKEIKKKDLWYFAWSDWMINLRFVEVYTKA